MEKTKKTKENGSWKTFDISAAVKQDLSAALAFLAMIRDNPELLATVAEEIRKWRDQMIANEKQKPKS